MGISHSYPNLGKYTYVDLPKRPKCTICKGDCCIGLVESSSGNHWHEWYCPYHGSVRSFSKAEDSVFRLGNSMAWQKRTTTGNA